MVSRAIHRCQNLHLQILALGQFQDLQQVGEQMTTQCTPMAKPQCLLTVASSGCLRNWQETLEEKRRWDDSSVEGV